MTRRAVILSDLHLSSNASLDDFFRDEDFEELLRLPALEPGAQGVDLVLLGDTFDLWQSVSDQECEAPKVSQIDLGYGTASEVERLAGVAARHPRWFAGLGTFARRDGARVVVVPGNHDRSLVDPGVQAALAGHLGLAAGSASLSFPGWYEDAGLALYADHGSQYDRNNDVQDFAALDWKRDSAGYYFVKLFFNRIEHRDPRIENSPGGWAGIWHWLRRVANFRLLAAAIRWFWQYWTDPRVPRRIGPARAPGAEPSAIGGPSAPLLLVAGGGKRGAFFAADPEMEQFFREAYQRSADVRVAVNEILDARDRPSRGKGRPAARAAKRVGAARRLEELARPRSVVPRPTPSRPVPAVRPRTTRGPPSDVEWAEKLFTDGPWFRPRLSRPDFAFVIFGHTHGELTWRLSNGATYLNTGTWTSPDGPLPVVVAEATPGGPTARLLHLSEGNLS